MAKPLPTIIVQGAIEILSDRKRWCRFSEAQDKDSYDVEPTNKAAVSFCAIGALQRAAFDLTGDSKESRKLQRDLQQSIEDMTADGAKYDNDEGLLDGINDRSPRGRTRILNVFKKYLAQEQV